MDVFRDKLEHALDRAALLLENAGVPFFPDLPCMYNATFAHA
jgi:hypothetical protein